MKIGYIGNCNDLKILNKRDIKCNIIVKNNEEFNKVIENLKSGDTVVIPRASSVCNDLGKFMLLTYSVLEKDCKLMLALPPLEIDEESDDNKMLILSTAVGLDLYCKEYGF